jgi:hypothetical protein
MLMRGLKLLAALALSLTMTASPIRTTVRIGSLVVVALLVSGCATPTGRIAADTDRHIAAGVCEVWRPVSYDSRRDTPETIAEAQANNRARAAFCQ